MTGTSKGAKKAARTRKARKEEVSANQMPDRDDTGSQGANKNAKDHHKAHTKD